MNYLKKTYRYYLRRVLGSLLKGNNLFINLYNFFYKVKNKKEFWNQVKSREDLLFEYEELAAEIPFFPIEKAKDSNFYGHAYNFRKYINDYSNEFSIEHGLMYGNYVPYAYSLKSTSTILVMSEYRKRMINTKIRKKIIPIGPYIHYAESLFDENKIKKIKEDLGKTLLYFPSHGTAEENIETCLKKEIVSINELKQKLGIKTVLVCMYYYDILHSNMANLFKAEGYKIVSAGHRLDLNFIRRLKSIILLCDVAISNSVGTQLGYCVYLGKPFYIIDNPRTNNMPEDYQKIEQAFSQYEIPNSEMQIKIASEYWGFKDIISPESFLNLIFS